VLVVGKSPPRRVYAPYIFHLCHFAMLRLVAAASFAAPLAAVQLSTTLALKVQASDPVRIVDDDIVVRKPLIQDIVQDVAPVEPQNLEERREIASAGLKEPTILPDMSSTHQESPGGHSLTSNTSVATDEAAAIEDSGNVTDPEIIEDITRKVVNDIVHDMEEQPEMAVEARDGKETTCSNIDGKYMDSGGKEVSIFQQGCYLRVALWSSEVTEGSAMKPGQIIGDSLYVKGVEEEGHVDSSGDISFGSGIWKKLAGDSLDSGNGILMNSSDESNVANVASNDEIVNQSSIYQSHDDSNVAVAATEPCEDVSGDYNNEDGQMVIVSQTGCDLRVTLKADGAADYVRTGSVDGVFVKVDGITQVAALRASKDIQFLDGPTWKKIAESALALHGLLSL